MEFTELKVQRQYGLGIVAFIVAVLFIGTVILTIKSRKQQNSIDNLNAVTTQLEKCVTILEQVHLVNENGEITHATVETSSTAATHVNRTPVLSE